MTRTEWGATQQQEQPEPVTAADLVRDARAEMPGIDDFLIGWLSGYAGPEKTAKAIADYRSLHADTSDDGAAS